MLHSADNSGIAGKRCLVTLTLLALSGAPCLAQIAPDVDPAPADAAPAKPIDNAWLEPLILKLDSDDLKTRERAASDIQTNVRLTLEALEQRVADTSRPLSPEQTLRINEVAVRLFRQTVRGAMGVSFARSVPEGVEIGQTIANFDSVRVLRAGDIIRQMDGIPIITMDEARAVIISHDPGDEVKLSIVRNSEPLEVSVRLGRLEDLKNAYALNDRIAREAWRIRCDRRSPPALASNPIDAGLTPAQWAQVDAKQRRLLIQSAELTRTNRLQVADDDGSDGLIGGGSFRKLESQPLVDFVSNDADARNSPAARNLQNQIDLQIHALRGFERDLARQPNMPEAQRQMILRQMMQCRQQVQLLRAQRQRILESPKEFER